MDNETETRDDAVNPGQPDQPKTDDPWFGVKLLVIILAVGVPIVLHSQLTVMNNREPQRTTTPSQQHAAPRQSSALPAWAADHNSEADYLQYKALMDSGQFKAATRFCKPGHSWLEKQQAEEKAAEAKAYSLAHKGMTWVKGYTRANGTYVSGYWRR
jgi:hypothetical protein